jgi:undecaprenyl-diphosphatase
MASKKRRPGWRRWLKGIGQLERQELYWLAVGLAACILLLIFLKLASEISEGETQAFDVMILKALRNPDDASRIVGPPWLEGSLLDLTALGGTTVLGFVIFAIVGFLLLQARYRTALFIAATSFTGMLVGDVLKQVFNRPRPTVVPHLRDVFTTSFPSGHAMDSAIVYLTLGAILMRMSSGWLTKTYCMVMATLLTFLVGASRVYLGVHYPTDVIGGWIIGFVWASICWLGAQQYEERAGLTAEKSRSTSG